MATTNENDSAATGGILVILGIVVALAAVWFYTQRHSSSTPTVNIETPSVSVPKVSD